MCEINCCNAEEIIGQEAAMIRFLFEGEPCRMEGDVFVPGSPGIKSLACNFSPLAPSAWDLVYEMVCGLSQGIEDADLDRLEDCVLEGMQTTKEAHMAHLEAACRADVGDEIFNLIASAQERAKMAREIRDNAPWGETKRRFWAREAEKADFVGSWWSQYMWGLPHWQNICQWEYREADLANAVEVGHKMLALITKVRQCIRVMIEAGNKF